MQERSEEVKQSLVDIEMDKWRYEFTDSEYVDRMSTYGEPGNQYYGISVFSTQTPTSDGQRKETFVLVPDRGPVAVIEHIDNQGNVTFKGDHTINECADGECAYLFEEGHLFANQTPEDLVDKIELAILQVVGGDAEGE